VQGLRKVHRNTNFVGSNVGIRGNHTTAAEIDTFAHHVAAEKALFALEDLTNARRTLLGEHVAVLGAVHVAVDGLLELDPVGHHFGQIQLLALSLGSGHRGCRA